MFEFFPLEVADILATTPAAVNSALQPARTRLQDLSATEDLIEEPSDPTSSALIDRYITSFDRADVAGITRLLADEVVLQMPPVQIGLSEPSTTVSSSLVSFDDEVLTGA